MWKNEKGPINPDPFQGEWIDRFYNTMIYGPYNEDYLILITMLIDRYIQQLNKLQGLDIPHMGKNLLQDAAGNWSSIGSDTDIMEWLMEYEKKNYDLFLYAASMGGFEVLQLPLENNDMYSCQIKGIRDYLKSLAREIPHTWRLIFWQAADCIWQSNYYIEDGTAFFLKNRDIWWYKTFCRKYMKRVKPYLQREKQVIDELLDNLRYPLLYTNEYKNGFSDENYFIFFDLGSNGYNEYDFSALNYRWVFSCLAFGSLMKQFKENASQITGAEEGGCVP